jgi:hypothetical protein
MEIAISSILVLLCVKSFFIPNHVIFCFHFYSQVEVKFSLSKMHPLKVPTLNLVILGI